MGEWTGDPDALCERLEKVAKHYREMGADATASLFTEAAACIREMVEWRTIETAPRDGTWILGSWGEAHPVVFGVVMWDGDQWRESDDVVSDPTHWLPLPPAPGAEDE